jgi:hypothetical protein
MAYTRTLLQLRSSLAKRAGIAGASGDTSSQSLTASVLNEFLNDAIEEAWDVIVGKWEDYYTKSAAQAVVAGTDAYAVPTDFLKLRRVWVLESGTKYKRLYPGDLDSAEHFTDASVGNKGYRYRLQERNLILMPSPAIAETLKIYYIPIATQLVSDADVLTFDVPMEMKYVLTIAWRDCLDAQNLDPSPAIQKMADLLPKFRTSADSRDAGEPFYLDPSQSFDDAGDDWIL